MLLVPFNHELAQRGSIDKCELYNLDFVSMNQGSSVQAAQEETLLQQGIKWHKLRTHMVGALLTSFFLYWSLIADCLLNALMLSIACWLTNARSMHNLHLVSVLAVSSGMHDLTGLAHGRSLLVLLTAPLLLYSIKQASLAEQHCSYS